MSSTQVVIEEQTVAVTVEQPEVSISVPRPEAVDVTVDQSEINVSVPRPETVVTLSKTVPGPQGEPGVPGVAFGEFWINEDGALCLDYVGELSTDDFTIGTDGTLEVRV